MRALAHALALALLPALALAQAPVTSVTTTPSGSCSVSDDGRVRLVKSTGAIYCCNSGNWAVCGTVATHTHAGGDVTSAVANATNATSAGNADTLDSLHASSFAQIDGNGDLTLPVGGIKLGTSIGGTPESTPMLTVKGFDWAEGPTLGSLTDSAAFFGPAEGYYGLLIGVGGSGSPWLQAQRSDAGTATYPLRLQPSGSPVAIGGSGSGSDGHKLSLETGSGDHVFMTFFADYQNIGVRTGWLGYGYVGSTALRVDSEKGPLELNGTGSIWLFVDGTARGTFDASGNFAATGNVTAYASISDERLKKNIQPIEGALEKVERIRSVTHEWRDEKLDAAGFNPTRGRVHGVIAQDVQRVMPDAVFEAKGEDGETYLGVRYERLVPLLLASIKELEARVAKLEGQRRGCGTVTPVVAPAVCASGPCVQEVLR